MTASDTMAAPYGRVMSGRGFAPASFQVHDKPATGQLAKDLYKVGGIANMDSWLQQAKTSNHLKLFGKDFLNNQIPSAMSDARLSKAADDAETHHPAKRARLSIPVYGRSASDPPLSFARRHTNAMDMPVEVPKLGGMSCAGREVPKALRSMQSGPARLVDGRPSPNYRIYSNAFQGGRVSGNGLPSNYSHSKAENASLANVTSVSSQGQSGVRSGPTPHPALLRQPLLGKRPSSNGPASRQPPDQMIGADLAKRTQDQHFKDSELTAAQAELTARLQHMQSIVRGKPNPSLPVNPTPADSSPQPAASSKHSVSHESHSNGDTEMGDASHGSHGESEQLVHPGSDSPRASALGAKGSTLVAHAAVTSTEKLLLDSSRRSPAPRDSNSPKTKDPTASEDGISPSFKGGIAAGDGTSPRMAEGMDSSNHRLAAGASVSPRFTDQAASRDHAEPVLGSTGPPDMKLPSRKPGLSKPGVTAKGRPARPWSNLSSALQPPFQAPAQEAVTTAQLQSILTGCMREAGDPRHQAALAGITEASVQQWLNQLCEAAGGKVAGQRSILPRVSSQEQLFAGQHSNLPRAIQAQLHVMRDSFNRVARPNMRDQPQLPPYASGSIPANSTSFPPNGYEHLRGVTAPDVGASATGSANSLLPLPISSSTKSSLPPSVASWLEQEQQQQRQQLPGRSQIEVSQHKGLDMAFGQQQLGQGRSMACLSGVSPTSAQQSTGFGLSSKPLDSIRIGSSNKWYDNLGSGLSLPSRVIAEGAVRNPALLNRPVRASHRDPQPGPQDQSMGLWASSRVQQDPLPGRALNDLSMAGGMLQHAQRESSLSPRAAGSSFLPNPVQPQGAASTVHTLAAMLGNSNLSSAELYSITGNTHAGNLNQLISQLQMATQLAQAQGESPQPLVETTHRVVIPAAHLKEGSHALSRQSTAAMASVLAQNTAAMVADRGNQHHQPQGRAVEAIPTEAKSALDLVAEAAAAEAANEEPSELLMLAAETLAGLNNMQPRSSGDHPETASASLDHSSSESPAAARKLSKQSLRGNRKQRPHNVKHSQKPVMQTASAASVHSSTGGVSVHPVLGLYVPHARRSYHREGTAAAVKAAPTGTIANQGLLFALARPKAAAPALGRRRKGPDTGSGHVKAAPVLRRMPSDSSMTVSVDSGGN